VPIFWATLYAFGLFGLMLYIRQTTCQECVFPWRTFFGVVPFSSYSPRKLSEAIKMSPKICFWEKRPLSGKISKFRHEVIDADNDSGIPAKFREIAKSVKRKSPKRCVDFMTKIIGKSYFLAPFSGAGAMSPKILQGYFPPLAISLLPSFVQIHPVFRDMYAKMSFPIITISAWSLWVSRRQKYYILL